MICPRSRNLAVYRWFSGCNASKAGRAGQEILGASPVNRGDTYAPEFQAFASLESARLVSSEVGPRLNEITPRSGGIWRISESRVPCRQV